MVCRAVAHANETLLRSLAGRSGGTFLSEVHDLLAGDEQGGD
jgi:hypothetical protein